MKTTVIAVVMVLSAVFLAGCPENDAISPETTIVTAEQPDTDGGSLRVKGDLYGTSNKVLMQDDKKRIGDAFKSKAAKLQVSLSSVEKGGDVRNYFFDFPIVDGRFDGTAQGIIPGDYWVTVWVINEYYYSLFQMRSKQISIVGGQTQKCPIVLDFCDFYFVYLTVDNLPGRYDKNGNAQMITTDGNTYYTHWWTRDLDGKMIFGIAIPLDFNGCALVITDLDGNVYQPDIPLDMLAVDFNAFNLGNDVFTFNYVPASWLGGLDVDISFAWENQPEHYVRVGTPAPGVGVEYPDIQSAIDNGISETVKDIYIGGGDYDGFTVPYGKSVAVIGLGADISRIVDNNPNRPHVIYASPWDYPTTKAEADSNIANSSPDNKGGGGQYLQLFDVTVYNGYGKRNEFYSDAAILVEAGISLTMGNVVVASESNSCISMNYDHSASINHCILVGPGFFGHPWSGSAKAIAAYNEQDVWVSDSIILGVSQAFYCSNGAVGATYNCVDNVGSLFYCERNPDWLLDITTFIFANPEFGNDWHLLPTSFCIGRASDQFDIGIVWE